MKDLTKEEKYNFFVEDIAEEIKQSVKQAILKKNIGIFEEVMRKVNLLKTLYTIDNYIDQEAKKKEKN